MAVAVFVLVDVAEEGTTVSRMGVCDGIRIEVGCRSSSVCRTTLATAVGVTVESTGRRPSNAHRIPPSSRAITIPTPNTA